VITLVGPQLLGFLWAFGVEAIAEKKESVWAAWRGAFIRNKKAQRRRRGSRLRGTRKDEPSMPFAVWVFGHNPCF